MFPLLVARSCLVMLRKIRIYFLAFFCKFIQLICRTVKGSRIQMNADWMHTLSNGSAEMTALQVTWILNLYNFGSNPKPLWRLINWCLWKIDFIKFSVSTIISINLKDWLTAAPAFPVPLNLLLISDLSCWYVRIYQINGIL